MPQKKIICLTFHTELLHDDPLWQKIAKLLDFFNRNKVVGTWFSIAPIHQYYIKNSYNEQKWIERLHILEEKNQVIEQHTHFYGVTKGPYDISKENIKKRLLEDKRWLEHNGFEIKGFLGGGWTIPIDLLKLLACNNFRYDCTFFESKKNYTSVIHCLRPVNLVFKENKIVELPTYSMVSLFRALSLLFFHETPKYFQKGNCLFNDQFYIFYLHDYSLKSFQGRFILITFVKLLKMFRFEFISMRELVKRVEQTHLNEINLGE